jgi:hypothetical protein
MGTGNSDTAPDCLVLTLKLNLNNARQHIFYLVSKYKHFSITTRKLQQLVYIIFPLSSVADPDPRSGIRFFFVPPDPDPTQNIYAYSITMNFHKKNFKNSFIMLATFS